MLFQPKFHAFCLLKIGPKICAYLFWCHWMLLRFGDFLQLPFRRFFVKLIQVFHAIKISLLNELHNTINTYWYIGDSIYKNISRMHILKMETFSDIVDPLPVLIVLETL